MISGYTLHYHLTVFLITTITFALPWTPRILSCDNGVLKSGNGKGSLSFNSSTESCSLVKAPVPNQESPCSQHNDSGIGNLHVQGSGKSFRISWTTFAVNDSNIHPWQFKVVFYVEEVDVISYHLPYCQYLKFLHNDLAVNENTRDIFQNCVYNGQEPITLSVFVFSLTTPSCAWLSFAAPDISMNSAEVTFIDNTGDADDDEDQIGHSSTATIVGCVTIPIVMTVMIIGIVLYIRKRSRASQRIQDSVGYNNSNTVPTDSKEPHASVPEADQQIYDHPPEHSPLEGRSRLPSFMRKAMIDINRERDKPSSSSCIGVKYYHNNTNNNKNDDGDNNKNSNKMYQNSECHYDTEV